jgi:hypothetical protein
MYLRTQGSRRGGVDGLAAVGRTDRAYIRWIQHALNTASNAALAVDGIMGPRTRAALRLFQLRHGLRPDGIPGPLTERAIAAVGAAPRPAPTAPAVPVRAGPAAGCPEPSRSAVDRCLRPGTQTCPAIPDLLCVPEVDGIPFEFPDAVRRDSVSGLTVVTRRTSNVPQRFTPPVRDALIAFVTIMRRFGMPIEAILTFGSLYCRCVTGTDTLSNHSFGDAIDIVGVRWPPFGGPASRLRETIVHNYADTGERALLRRINACLRLSFATVIDYHRDDHRDHFHCDMNRGRGRVPRGTSTMVFVQEALTLVLGRSIPASGRLDALTQQALQDVTGLDRLAVTNPTVMNRALDSLFTRVAAGS